MRFNFVFTLLLYNEKCIRVCTFRGGGKSLFMKGKGTNMLRLGMNVQNTTCGVSCDALRHTFSDVSYYSRC